MFSVLSFRTYSLTAVCLLSLIGALHTSCLCLTVNLPQRTSVKLRIKSHLDTASQLSEIFTFGQTMGSLITRIAQITLNLHESWPRSRIKCLTVVFW